MMSFLFYNRSNQLDEHVRREVYMKKQELLRELDILNNESGHFLSLYQNTVRQGEDKMLAPIQFKNQIKAVTRDLQDHFDKDDAKSVLTQLSEIQEDTNFWTHQGEGLALFARGNKVITITLNEDVSNITVVQKTPHILPLLEANQHVEDHYILDLRRDSFKVYESTITQTNEVVIDGVAAHFSELFDDLDSNVTVSASNVSGGNATFHGYADSQEEQEKDHEKYYRYLDDKLTPWFEKQGHRVILSGVSANVAKWAGLVDSKLYVREDLGKPYSDFSAKELRNKLKEIFAIIDQSRVSEAVESFNKALAASRGATVRQDIRNALEAAKVERLLIQSDWKEENRAELDEFANSTLAQGGKVTFVPRDYDAFAARVGAMFRY